MSTPTNISAPLSVVYCTDEQIALRDPDDFTVLTPHHQCLARGTDGTITAASPWTLTSATVNFQTNGVASGNVVVLALKNVFVGSGEAFAVDTVSGSSVTLRRLGQLTGVGQPPATTADLSNIAFTIGTLGPQIEDESFSLNREYSIDPTQPGRDPSSMDDLRDLREACILQVLKFRYARALRTGDGDFKTKYVEVKDALDGAKARLQVRWAIAITNIIPPPSTKFSTRLHR